MAQVPVPILAQVFSKPAPTLAQTVSIFFYVSLVFLSL
jgi:hypothetical protein